MSAATQGNESCLPPKHSVPQTDFPAPTGPTPDPNPNQLPTLVTPDGTTFVVRHGLDEIAQLCQLGMTPRVITGLLIRTLKNHFSDPALIMDPKLQQYVWNQDSTKSKIRIIPNANFDAKSAGQLPAIIVARGELASKRVVMDDHVQFPSENSARNGAGVKKYLRFHTTSFMVTVISEALGEVEDLASEVFDTLSYLSPMMTERLSFHDFQVVGMGQVGALTEVGTQLAVPIQLSTTYEYAWTLEPLAPRLKSLSIPTTS